MNTSKRVRPWVRFAAVAAAGLASIGLARTASADPHRYQEPYYQDRSHHGLSHDESHSYAGDWHAGDITTRQPREGIRHAARRPYRQRGSAHWTRVAESGAFGPLTRQELRLVARLGPEIDRNRDRRLSAREARTASELIRLRRTFTALDRDRDARLFRNETRDWLRHNFDTLDLNANLSLTWDEIERSILFDSRATKQASSPHRTHIGGRHTSRPRR